MIVDFPGGIKPFARLSPHTVTDHERGTLGDARTGDAGAHPSFRAHGVVQAAEVFHRKHRENTKESRAEYNRNKSKVLEKFQDPTESDLIIWLKDVLQYNKLTLRMRLESLYEDFGKIMKYCTCNNKDQFADKILHARNGLTHEGQAETDNDALWKYSMWLYILLTCCLLKEIGIEQGKIDSSVKKCFEWLVPLID